LPFIFVCGSLGVIASRSPAWGSFSISPFFIEEKSLTPQKKLSSLSDLGQLLSDSERKQLLSETNKRGHDGKGKTVRVRLDTKGRKGKSVTLVEGLQHNPATMEEIARILKQHCGAGGTVKEGQIEVQGDQRQRIVEKLREMNYVVR
jgi:translation initiation factor 1